MKFLKTLQKKQLEKPLDIDALDNEVVPQSNVKRDVSNQSPELRNFRNLKIEKQNFTFNNQNESLIDLLSSNDTLPYHVKTNDVDKASPDSFLLKAIDPERVNPRLVAITQPNSAYSEEYRSLRTQLLHQSEKQKLQSIVVASLGPSEGKSVTAINLSWLLAQTDGIKALIIDSDLRKPSVAEYLGIETEIGLSEVLEGKSTLKETIIRLDPGGLHLLPGGQARRDLAELVSGLKFKEILSELSQMFDYVIIDAPPLGVFADAAVLINYADAALLVVQANKTRYKDIERVLEMLPRDKLIGAVLNQSEDTLISDSSYYYNYYKERNQ